VQAIAPQPAPQALFGQPGYGVGGYAALPAYLDVDLGVAYTNNALLTSSDRMSTAIGTVGMDTNYSYIGSDLDILVRGNVALLHYFDNAFRNTAFGTFDAVGMWGHASDLLQWVVEETYAEGQTDPLAAPTPFYLEEVNYFTTGPYLNFNLSTTDRLTFYGLYSNTVFQNEPFNSDTLDGGSTFTHGLSSSSSVSLIVDSAYTSFEEAGFAALYGNVAPVAPDIPSEYNMRSAQVVYTEVLARTRVSIGAGYGFEDFGGSYSGSPIATIDLTRQISASQSITLHGGYGYTTFGSAVRNNIAAGASPMAMIGAAPTLATAAPFKDHLLSAGWNFARARTAFSLFGSFDRVVYANEPLFNNRVETLTATLTRAIQPSLFLRLAATQSWSQYGELEDGKVTMTLINLSLRKQFRKVGISLYVQRADQGYSGAAAPLGLVAGAYTENRVGLEFSYDVLGQRGAGAALPEVF
jgi:hypothetical protein